MHRLGDKRVSLLRADSGFSDSTFLEYLDQRQIHHIIALRMNQPVQRALVNAEGWWVLHEEAGKPVQGIELTRFTYQANTWSKPRWVIGKYRYSALVTDLDLPAALIWRTCRGALIARTGSRSSNMTLPRTVSTCGASGQPRRR